MVDARRFTLRLLREWLASSTVLVPTFLTAIPFLGVAYVARTGLFDMEVLFVGGIATLGVAALAAAYRWFTVPTSLILQTHERLQEEDAGAGGLPLVLLECRGCGSTVTPRRRGWPACSASSATGSTAGLRARALPFRPSWPAPPSASTTRPSAPSNAPPASTRPKRTSTPRTSAPASPRPAKTCWRRSAPASTPWARCSTTCRPGSSPRHRRRDPHRHRRTRCRPRRRRARRGPDGLSGALAADAGGRGAGSRSGQLIGRSAAPRRCVPGPEVAGAASTSAAAPSRKPGRPSTRFRAQPGVRDAAARVRRWPRCPDPAKSSPRLRSFSAERSHGWVGWIG